MMVMLIFFSLEYLSTVSEIHSPRAGRSSGGKYRPTTEDVLLLPLDYRGIIPEKRVLVCNPPHGYIFFLAHQVTALLR